jgi:protein-tyrosine-phosphatase
MWLGYWFIAIFAFCASNFSQAQTSWPETNTSATTTLIRDGWIFGSLSDERRRNSGILLQGDQIVAVDTAQDTVTINSKLIQLTDDQTILSGFIDLHAHYSLDFFYEGRVDEAYYNSLVYLANGVTSTWSAGEMNPQRIIDQRNKIQDGEAIGPRLLSSGPYFGGFRCEYDVKVAEDDCVAWPNDITDDEIRQEVDYWTNTGIRSIKIKQSTPHETKIIIDQAKKHGLTTTGHLANYLVEYDVSTLDAITMGMDRIEHQLLLALSPQEADPNELAEIIQLMIDKQVYYDPNLQMYGSVNLRQKHIHDMIWTDEAKYFTPYAKGLLEARGSPPPESDWAEYRQRVIELLELYKAGGANLIVTGTDEPVYTTLLAGFAYHRELFALVDAGLPNAVVLKAGTINGAKALGIDNLVGTIKPGKLADIIVVNGNPLKDITAARDIAHVIANGIIHNPNNLLQSVENRIGPKNKDDHEFWMLEIPPLRRENTSSR